MSQLVTAAILDQQMPTNEIREARAGFQAIGPNNGAAWSKFRPCKEIADLLKRSAVLQRETHQAGNHVVETDQFRGAIAPLEAQEDFCGVSVVMDAEVERALSSNLYLLSDVIATSGE